MTPFEGHPAVVGVEPGQPELVVLTAAAWARATGGALYLAYADPTRYAVEELPDGSVRHAPVDPDASGDEWQEREAALREHLTAVLADAGVVWQLRYLAGRPDRALTHLARVVDAAVIVVGTGEPGVRGSLRGMLAGSVSTHLSHHQHRPVLVVPLTVVDWKQRPASS
jgi:nucleotide-binding universal stress UspA family protein